MRELLLLALMAASAGAQAIEVESLFQPASLSGMWKHQRGDDRRWADPAFDDSAWPSVRMPEGAVTPGDGFSWYRFRVRLPATMPGEPLALMIGGFADSQAYEVFWNGQRAGVFGEPDGGASGLRIPVPRTFSVVGDGRDAVVAIRLRASAGGIPLSVQRNSWIGTEGGIRERAENWRGARLWSVLAPMLIVSSMYLSGILFLLLPLWRRDAPEYFWFGFWLVCVSTLRVFYTFPDVAGVAGSKAVLWIVNGASFGLVTGWLGWMRTLFLGRITPMLWLVYAAYVGVLLELIFFTWAANLTRPLNILSASVLTFIYWQLGWRTARKRDHPWAIHVAILAYLIVVFVTYGGEFFEQAEAFSRQGPLVRSVTGLIFIFAMTILMNQRSARLLAERQRLSGELASAAEVQSLLLTTLPQVGESFQIDPVYLPASEVGGDFYQVLERENGSRMVLVGDVSGKGLKAAMLVSATIGMLRRESSSSPGVILAGLNDGLAGHTGGGFVTCCCARFDRDGTVTVANAGHPTPYCDGRELLVEAGLPLGVLRGVAYRESAIRGERFTFVSDGVVEAANGAGELFGFERTCAISMQAAAAIAETAKQWGQNDDITVVTVRRSAA